VFLFLRGPQDTAISERITRYTSDSVISVRITAASLEIRPARKAAKLDPVVALSNE